VSVYGGPTLSWNSLQIQNDVNFFAAGGTVTEITQNGVVYRVHSFTTVGVSTFTVNRQLKRVEYLIVAGGGAGGVAELNPAGDGAGGGGAGGFLTNVGGNLLTISNQSYTITVGAGGVNTSGENSSVFEITAFGGGVGGGVPAGSRLLAPQL